MFLLIDRVHCLKMAGIIIIVVVATITVTLKSKGDSARKKRRIIFDIYLWEINSSFVGKIVLQEEEDDDRNKYQPNGREKEGHL